MGYKTFCDECEKEIKEDEYFKITSVGKKFETAYYCPNCFKKHWKEVKKTKVLEIN